MEFQYIGNGQRFCIERIIDIKILTDDDDFLVGLAIHLQIWTKSTLKILEVLEEAGVED